jgi:capsular polysaccharide biosynthesis protein
MRAPRVLPRRRRDAARKSTATTQSATSRGPVLLRRYQALLPAGADRTVVLLAEGPAAKAILPYLDAFAGHRIHVVSKRRVPEPDARRKSVTYHRAKGASGISAALKAVGPIDLIIVAIRDTDRAHAALWQRLFFFVSPGGSYVVLRQAIGPTEPDGLLDRLQRIVALQGIAKDSTTPLLDVRLAAATSRIIIDRFVVIIGKRTKHYLKVFEAEANELLSRRPSNTHLTVITTLPAGEWQSTTTVTSHTSSAPVPALGTTVTYPALHLRDYTGRVGLVGGSLLITDDAVLPDSFRHHGMPNPRNPRTVRISPEFDRVKAALVPRDTLAGSYYLLDSSYAGHFGHLMTEGLSKLWGWDLAKARNPDLKAIYRLGQPHHQQNRLEPQLFAAYGIAPQDIVGVDHPVWVEEMIGATPMWHNHEPHYVHPDMAAVWDRLGGGLPASDKPVADRIFVSRPPETKNRACRNSTVVEDLFAAHGFEIVYPERLSLPDQAGVFRNARVVAGFGGSALFNLAFCNRLETLIVVNHEAYTARNEHLFALVKGCDLHYFWSDPDIHHPDGRWTEDAFRSPWEFDVGRNRGPLTDLLTGLG